MVIDQRDHAIVALDQSRAALDPVTAVVICDLAEFADRCAVDVAAKHGVYVMALRVMRHGGFESADKAHRIFHASLGVGAERPVAQAEAAPDEIDKRIEREQKLIPKVAGERQPLHVLHHSIEFVAVNDQDALPGSGHVNCALLDLDIPVGATKAGHQFVVISWDINYAGALACFTQNFLDHVVVFLWPINSAPQRPNVDQVPDDVERVELGLAQKIE